MANTCPTQRPTFTSDNQHPPNPVVSHGPASAITYAATSVAVFTWRRHGEGWIVQSRVCLRMCVEHATFRRQAASSGGWLKASAGKSLWYAGQREEYRGSYRTGCPAAPTPPPTQCKGWGESNPANTYPVQRPQRPSYASTYPVRLRAAPSEGPPPTQTPGETA